MPLPDFADIGTFPTWEACPQLGSSITEGPAEWTLLAQVKNDMTINKPTLVLTDRTGAEFALVFDGLERDDLDLKKMGLKKDNTAVVPLARRTAPKGEGKQGFIIIEKGRAEQVRSIPGPLATVLKLGEAMREADNAEDTTVSCGSCGKKAAETPLKRCTGCGSVKYCSKSCQASDWSDGGHKSDCKVRRSIREIWA